MNTDTMTRFLRLSRSRRSTLVRQARDFIDRNPSCADHSTFWRGLSARQIIIIACTSA